MSSPTESRKITSANDSADVPAPIASKVMLAKRPLPEAPGVGPSRLPYTKSMSPVSMPRTPLTVLPAVPRKAPSVTFSARR